MSVFLLESRTNSMQRFHQLLFAASTVTLCWLLMQAVHELGHVLGALVTGGEVERVVIHPLRISRTDVSPNPHPGIVVWLGPLLGCVLPLGFVSLLPRGKTMLKNLAKFFAGFCLIANGAYISIGSFANIGDCGEMLRTGTPKWVMQAFGLVTIPSGLLIWHRLGSLRKFFKEADNVSARATYATLLALSFICLLAFTLSPS